MEDKLYNAVQQALTQVDQEILGKKRLWLHFWQTGVYCWKIFPV